MRTKCGGTGFFDMPRFYAGCAAVQEGRNSNCTTTRNLLRLILRLRQKLKSSATRTFNALANRSRDDHLTDHFGVVTDYLSECWTKLREGTRISALQGRAHWGGALSGRDIEAVSKTVSGLLKLLFPNPDMPIPDQELGGGPADRPGGAP